MARGRKALPAEPVEVLIESLTQDGRGVTHVNGKAVFIHGGLPGERLTFTYDRVQRRYDEGRAHQVLEASPDRVEPGCPHFGLCGGCALQHVRDSAQLGYKQQSLLDALQRIGKVTPERLLEPLVASHWGYRRKARLGVKYVAKKGRVLVGFREQGSPLVADLSQCPVLHPQVGSRLLDLAQLVEGLSIRDKLPQIEVGMGDDSCALVFRVLAPPSPADLDRLREFGALHGFVIYLQDGGPETVRPLDPPAPELFYDLPGEPPLRLKFAPLDFTQINLDLNRLLVQRALNLLDPQPQDRVLDLFCGIGNFGLALATRAGWVVGVEGSAPLVERAQHNAAANGLTNTEFRVADLYGSLEGLDWTGATFDQILLDPPRTGAQEILPLLPRLGAQRILYVSCYPSTLARDAGILVHDQGYRLLAAGVMDMFPHTAHVESMALFERARA